MDKEAETAALAFGLPIQGIVESLCTYGPVYKIFSDGDYWVLKRTGYPNSKGAAIAEWLYELKEHRVDVVSPDNRFAPNPRAIPAAGGEWVVYPFVRGLPYQASQLDIRSAGSLLGRIHKVESPSCDALLLQETLPVHSMGWQEYQIEKCKRVLLETSPKDAKIIQENLEKRWKEYLQSLTRLASSSLPLSGSSWDFKASNLIFCKPGQPVLVDPDHAAKIPRIFDLACALLMFHSDCATAPLRLFSIEEWTTFLEGYKQHVTFTVEERALWSDVLLAAWMDQGVWLMANWPEGWADQRDRQYLIALGSVRLSRFGLGRERQKQFESVVDRFLDKDGKIKSYPVKRSSRMEVLRFIANKLEPRRVYREAELNEFLKTIHTFGDWALLRRELSDEGFLTRSSLSGEFELANAGEL